MCIHTHTYEYTYMYSINSSVYYDVRDSIPIHTYMTILSLIYIYIYVYLYMYIFMYSYIHTHIHILIFYECIMHVQYRHVHWRSPRHFLYKDLLHHREAPHGFMGHLYYNQYTHQCLLHYPHCAVSVVGFVKSLIT